MSGFDWSGDMAKIFETQFMPRWQTLLIKLQSAYDQTMAANEAAYKPLTIDYSLVISLIDAMNGEQGGSVFPSTGVRMSPEAVLLKVSANDLNYSASYAHPVSISNKTKAGTPVGVGSPAKAESTDNDPRANAAYWEAWNDASVCPSSGWCGIAVLGWQYASSESAERFHNDITQIWEWRLGALERVATAMLDPVTGIVRTQAQRDTQGSPQDRTQLPQDQEQDKSSSGTVWAVVGITTVSLIGWGLWKLLSKKR